MIADLGLSKLGRADKDATYIITTASVTLGYCDPEYYFTGILTKGSDVYSFGVVMFEVLCGRLGFIKVDNEHRLLARLAQRYYEAGRLNEIIDPYLKIEVDSDFLKKFSEIAYPCLLSERDRRPSMSLLVQKLEELMASSKFPIFMSSSSNSKITAFIKESKHFFIPFQVIENATKNFTTILGNGGYGIVYKGELLLSGELTSVAVKRLDSKISGQGFKQFLTEIQLLSRYKHPNLVSLLGFCDEAGEKILIYEYAEHRSLDKHLTVSKITHPLTWERRISICRDTARGLDYLHNGIPTNHQVIHRDIKSANILIGHEWKVMIADLGLSKIGHANEDDYY
uniref:receptor-like protein kinase FERONIA n=1 Tax=Erigeron canadensis TaxID=72917 RepID=UPI001CB91334|nr:receptor-like protein kinase FERONIA [Erigeron canadensis]